MKSLYLHILLFTLISVFYPLQVKAPLGLMWKRIYAWRDSAVRWHHSPSVTWQKNTNHRFQTLLHSQVSNHPLGLCCAANSCKQSGLVPEKGSTIGRDRKGSWRKNPGGPEPCFLLLLQQAAGMNGNRTSAGQGACKTAISSFMFYWTLTSCLCISRHLQHSDSNNTDTLSCSHIFQNNCSSLRVQKTQLVKLASLWNIYLPLIKPHPKLKCSSTHLEKPLQTTSCQEKEGRLFTVTYIIWYLGDISAVRGFASFRIIYIKNA